MNRNMGCNMGRLYADEFCNIEADDITKFVAGEELVVKNEVFL